MVNPDLKPLALPAAPSPPVFVQSFDARLTIPFSTGVVLPATAIAVTLPIVVSAAGFLLINASASGRLSAPRLGAMIIRVDGVKVPDTAVSQDGGVGVQLAWSIAARVAITAGAHTITVEFGNTVALLLLSIDPVANPDLESCSLVIIESGA